MNWLFIAIILVVFGFGVYGYVRGLLKMLFSVVSLLMSIIAMIIVAPFVASLLKNNEPVMNTIEKPIMEVVGEKLDNGIDVEGVLEGYYHLPKSVSTKITEYAQDDITHAKDELSKNIAVSIAEYLCDLGSYLIVFITVRIIIIIVGRILKIVEKMPVINTMNHLGGTALALLEAFICIWIFFIIVELLQDTDIGRVLTQMIWENELLKGLYENNLLTFFLKN